MVQDATKPIAERYLEDFVVGQTFSSGRARITNEEIQAFAAQFDPQPVSSRRIGRARKLLSGIGGERLAHRRHHHAASGGERPEACRRSNRCWFRRIPVAARRGQAMSSTSNAKFSRCDHQGRFTTAVSSSCAPGHLIRMMSRCRFRSGTYLSCVGNLGSPIRLLFRPGGFAQFETPGGFTIPGAKQYAGPRSRRHSLTRSLSDLSTDTL